MYICSQAFGIWACAIKPQAPSSKPDAMQRTVPGSGRPTVRSRCYAATPVPRSQGSVTGVTSPGLKEWTAVCSALAQGDQTVSPGLDRARPRLLTGSRFSSIEVSERVPRFAGAFPKRRHPRGQLHVAGRSLLAVPQLFSQQARLPEAMCCRQVQ